MGQTVMGHLRELPDVPAIHGYDVNPAQLAALPAEWGIIPSPDLGALLADPQIKLVFITASNAAHAELAIAAMQAGKAVMCEKPMAASLADAQRMVQVARECGAFLQIGFELRYSKLYTQVKDWIDAGLIGTVRNIFCQYICSEFHRRGSWRNKAASGGMFDEKVSHYVDLPRWWVGEPVTEVHTLCAPNVVTYNEVHDNYHTSYRFANGTVSQLTFMMNVAESDAGDPLQDTLEHQADDGHALRYLLYGDHGAIETDVFRRRIRRWAFTDVADGLNSKIVESHTWTRDEDHMYFHNTRDAAYDIIRRVEAGEPPMIDPADSFQTARLCHAAEQSADQQRTVHMHEVPGEAATKA